MNMKERNRQQFLARQAEQAAQRKPAREPRRRQASREEQHGRYLDCGPLAWDDRDNPDY